MLNIVVRSSVSFGVLLDCFVIGDWDGLSVTLCLHTCGFVWFVARSLFVWFGFCCVGGCVSLLFGIFRVLFICCSDSDFMYSCGLVLGVYRLLLWFILLNGVCLDVVAWLGVAVYFGLVDWCLVSAMVLVMCLSGCRVGCCFGVGVLLVLGCLV